MLKCLGCSSSMYLILQWFSSVFLSFFWGSVSFWAPDRGQSPVEWGVFPVCPPLWAIQRGLRLSQPGLRPSQLGRRPSQPDMRPSQPAKPQASDFSHGWHGLRPGWLGFRPGWLGFRPGWMAQRGGTDRQMYQRKISPFYRTSSPIGATALPPPMNTKEKVEQGKGTADHLMPLGYLFFIVLAGFLSLRSV